MSLIARGLHFRKGEVIGSFQNWDPTQSETYRVDLTVEPGDIIYVVDDTLSTQEFGLVSQPTIEGRFSEAEIRKLTPARFEVTVPEVAVPDGATLRWTWIGRRDHGAVAPYTPGQTLAAQLKAKVGATP